MTSNVFKSHPQRTSYINNTVIVNSTVIIVWNIIIAISVIYFKMQFIPAVAKLDFNYNQCQPILQK